MDAQWLLIGGLVVFGIGIWVGYYLWPRRSGQEVQSAVLEEKLKQLEPVTQAVNRIERGLTELQIYAKARQDLEQRTAESIRRLEDVMAGTQSKGAAGEKIIELIFSKLPPEWQVRQFKIKNKTVEFGLRLPNGLILPIDSKWPATKLVEQLTQCDDQDERKELRIQIEGAVLNRVKEIKKYIDPNITVNFAIAVVPDAVYDLCASVRADAFKENVTLVSHSMLVPYLLLVFHTILKVSQSIDSQRLIEFVKDGQNRIEELQAELEGRFSNAIKMLANSCDEMKAHLRHLHTGLINLQMIATRSTSESGENRSMSGNTD